MPNCDHLKFALTGDDNTDSPPYKSSSPLISDLTLDGGRNSLSRAFRPRNQRHIPPAIKLTPPTIPPTIPPIVPPESPTAGGDGGVVLEGATFEVGTGEVTVGTGIAVGVDVA